MNKIYYLLVCFLFFICTKAQAQSTLVFTVKQAPSLLIDAGESKTIINGEKVKLGGTTPAAGGSGSYTYTWSPAKWLDKADIANPTATPDSTITYTLTVKDDKGCSQTSQIALTVNSVTGIADQKDELGLVIFPNPNKGSFYITSDIALDTKPLLLEIYDNLGKLIYKETIDKSGRTLNLHVKLPHNKSLFILRLSGSKVNTTRKIVVE